MINLRQPQVTFSPQFLDGSLVIMISRLTLGFFDSLSPLLMRLNFKLSQDNYYLEKLKMRSSKWALINHPGRMGFLQVSTSIFGTWWDMMSVTWSLDSFLLALFSRNSIRLLSLSSPKCHVLLLSRNSGLSASAMWRTKLSLRSLFFVSRKVLKTWSRQIKMHSLRAGLSRIAFSLQSKWWILSIKTGVRITFGVLSKLIFSKPMIGWSGVFLRLFSIVCNFLLIWSKSSCNVCPRYSTLCSSMVKKLTHSSLREALDKVTRSRLTFSLCVWMFCLIFYTEQRTWRVFMEFNSIALVLWYRMLCMRMINCYFLERIITRAPSWLVFLMPSAQKQVWK